MWLVDGVHAMKPITKGPPAFYGVRGMSRREAKWGVPREVTWNSVESESFAVELCCRLAGTSAQTSLVVSENPSSFT